MIQSLLLTILKLTQEELTQMDKKTKKQMTMHKAFQPKDNIDCMYQKMKEQEKLQELKPAPSNNSRNHKRRPRKTNYCSHKQ